MPPAPWGSPPACHPASFRVRHLAPMSKPLRASSRESLVHKGYRFRWDLLEFGHHPQGDVNAGETWRCCGYRPRTRWRDTAMIGSRTTGQASYGSRCTRWASWSTSTSLVVELLEDARHHVSILNAGRNSSARIALAERISWMASFIRFRRLVLDDDSSSSCASNNWLLCVEHAVEPQIVAVGHARPLNRLSAPSRWRS